jgi:polar amino acid transport system substrate-binding protein
MPITSERQRAAAFSDPYCYAPGQLFVKEGGSHVTGVADLAGRRVGVGAATTYYEFLKKESDAVVKTYSTDAAMFRGLRNGSVDFIMTAGPTGQEAISRGQLFESSGGPLYCEELAFAVKKSEADWLELLNYSVKTMHEDGSLTDMSLMWYDCLDLTKKAE